MKSAGKLLLRYKQLQDQSPKQDHLVNCATSRFDSMDAFLDNAEADIIQLGS